MDLENKASGERALKKAIISMEVRVCVFSHVGHVQHFATPWMVALQISLSMEFSKQEYWSGLPFLTLGVLLDPEMEPMSLSSSALAG